MSEQRGNEEIDTVSLFSYAGVAISHLQSILQRNQSVLQSIVARLSYDVSQKRFLFVFGSGHSALLPLELYHRAGGPSYMIPLVADFLLPSAGPPVVRLFERMPESAIFLLNRAQPLPGEMIWLVSQSGINAAVVELALEAKKRNLHTIGFTSMVHSQAVPSRHPSGKKLYEVCDDVVDWGGVIGDSVVPLNSEISAGPLSTLTGIFLAHSILTAVAARLEKSGIRCTYTSVNTPSGELRNKELEKFAMARDPLLR